MDKREPITASNLGPVVSVIAWIMAISVIIAVIIKTALSSVVLGKRITEDTVLFLATSFSIGFTVALSLAVPQGIGRHQDTLSSNQLDALQKRVHSAHVLLILVSSCAQTSVMIFLREITPDEFHRGLIYAVATFVGLSSIPIFFIAIFACRTPSIWRFLGDQCIDQLSFWEAFAGINIGIEAALVILPILIVYPLMMERTRKAIVVSGFAARLAVMAAFAFYLYEARRLKGNLDDWTFHSWRWFLASVLVQGLSIITVCIPYIRNLLLSMESGMIQTGHFRLQNGRNMETDIQLPTMLNATTSVHSGKNSDRKANFHANSQGEHYVGEEVSRGALSDGQRIAPD